MANSKSALKNVRKARVRTERNRMVKSRLKTLEKKFRACLDGEDEGEARQVAVEFISGLDKAAKSSIVHPNKVSRKKSFCSNALKGTGKVAPPTTAEETPPEEGE